MIRNNSNPTEFINWNDVPVATENETVAAKAPYTFFAETTLSEKIWRIFNAAMFGIVGIKLLTLIPGVGPAALNLGAMAFAAIGGASLLQIPAVLTIAAVAPKVIVALAIILVIRKVLAVAIYHIIYPAVSVSYANKFDTERWGMFALLNREGYECRRIALNKSGIDYDSFAVSHPNNGNDQWAIVAGGNGWIGEESLYDCAIKMYKLGFNVLYVNGPGVARSTGFPTSYSIGAGQEAGLQFLEKAFQPKTMLLYGTSLGGGAQSEAIVSHAEFKKAINYIAWSDRTFDTLSNTVRHLITILAKPVFFLLGIELDNLAGAKKLQELGIAHIITQNSQNGNGNEAIDEEGSDDVIPNRASLYVGLRKTGSQDPVRVRFHVHPAIRHNEDFPWGFDAAVNQDVEHFVQNPLPRKD